MKRATSSCIVNMLCALCLGTILYACSQSPPGRGSDGTGMDLADRFRIAAGEGAPAGNANSLMRHFRVTRRGRQMDTTTLIAPVAIRAGLGGLSGRFALKILASPVFNVGDGVQMDVILDGAGQSKQVGRHYFDAGRIAGDRDWIALEYPVDLTGAADAYLEIRISAGPQGDLVADWIALAEVRITREGATR